MTWSDKKSAANSAAAQYISLGGRAYVDRRHTSVSDVSYMPLREAEYAMLPRYPLPVRAAAMIGGAALAWYGVFRLVSLLLR